jgi:hypothetical protein
VCQAPQAIGPGTGSIDQHRRLPASIAAAHRPSAGASLDRVDRRIAQDLAAARAQSAQKSLMQRMHVDIAGIGLKDGGAGDRFAQHRHPRQHIGRLKATDLGRDASHGSEFGLEQGVAAWCTNHQGAARRQDRDLRKTVLPGFEKGTTGA